MFDLIILSCIFFLLWQFKQEWKSRRQAPGPIQLPIIGNLLQLALYPKSKPIYEILDDLSKTYGKVFRIQAGVTSQLIISDFELIKVVNTNPSDVWIDRHVDEWLMERSYGKPLGILFSGGDIWKESRRFILRKLRDFGVGKQKTQDEIIHEELIELFDYIETKQIDAKTRDLNMKHVFTVSILNILWRFITSTRFNYEDPKLQELFNTLEIVSQQFSLAGDILMAFPKLRHILPVLTGHGKARRVFEPKMLKQFQNLLDTRRSSGQDFMVEQDLTDAFLKQIETLKNADANDSNKYHPDVYTDQNFNVIGMDLFMAGSETSSNLLEFAFLFMILHREIQLKVRNEIVKVIGRDQFPVYQNLASMPFTEATLLEVTRMGTVVPFMARVPSEDVKLASYEVPKDTMIVCNLHAVHFDPEYWKDPNVFRPERFLDESGKICNEKKNHLLGFGIGRRQCIGESLAKSTTFIYFTSFLQRYSFQISPNYPIPKLEKRVGLTVAPLKYYVQLKLLQ